MAPYKLRCNLVGHEKDVRALCQVPQPEGAILSGSRDVTARVWVPNEHSNTEPLTSFTEGMIFSGHSGFVASVCVLPASEEHPEGLIATGSNDQVINVYTFTSPAPLYKLQGHKDTVCSLSAGKFGTLLSGSWDKTAKVWLKEKNVMTLEGHSLAVWCVAVMPENGYMVTGAADKLIKIWRAGKCETTLKGHDDCVRGLAVINASEFLSCSNDSSIRRWSLTAGVLQVYYGHTNFVYGIALLPGSSDFVSVSEDRSLRVWRNGESAQTITHPCVSVWSVCTLPNGDIVTGSSDSVIRVFSNDTSRQAPADDIKAFEEAVSSSHIPTQVGDIDTEKVPGPEILLAPGKKDGFVQMVKDGTNVEVHQWSSAEQKWSKVGDVVGSSEGSSGKGRTLYEGREYDFVFSVDIAEGEPPLKLPYNMTEDPWSAAQNFITKHGLNQAFLEQVRDFIVQNTQSVSMTQQSANSSYRDPYTGSGAYVPGASPMDTGTGYSDPFTGGGRYVPGGSNTGPQSNNIPSAGVDPFTGSGSYRPGGAPPTSGSGDPASNAYFPLSNVITFNTIKPDAVIKKLKELNKQLPGTLKCVDSDIDAIIELCNIDKTPTAPMLTYLWRLLQWPKEQVFPALDIMRVAIRNSKVNEYFCNSKEGPEFLQHLVKFLAADHSATNHMLALRTIANLSAQQNGEDLLQANSESIIPLMTVACRSKNKNIEIAASTVLLNLAVLLKRTDEVETKSQLISGLNTCAVDVLDTEAKFRLCVGLGTLLWKDDNSIAMAKSLDVGDSIEKWILNTELPKLQECARYVSGML